MHTAQWHPDVVSAGSGSASPGTGASAVQIIPHLAESAEELAVFARHRRTRCRARIGRSASRSGRLRVEENARALREQLLLDADRAFAQRLRLVPDIDEIRIWRSAIWLHRYLILFCDSILRLTMRSAASGFCSATTIIRRPDSPLRGV